MLHNGKTAEDKGPLRALMLIESVGDIEPFDIVPVSQCRGTAVTPEEAMATRVKWAHKAGYSVLTKDVPAQFAPYNAVIRVSESGTEDLNRDYLARIIDETLLPS